MIESPYWQNFLFGAIVALCIGPFIFLLIYIIADFFSKIFQKRR